MTPSPGTCRWCDCTEEHACAGGCKWVDDRRTVCSQCNGPAAIAAALVLFMVGYAAQAGVEAEKWDDAAWGGQRALVTAVRTYLELAMEKAVASITPEGMLAIGMVDEIRGFIGRQAPEEIRPEEPVSLLVKRLLGPHLGSRVLVPGGRR